MFCIFIFNVELKCWKIRYFLLGNFPELNFKSYLLNQKFYVTFMNWLIQMTYECLDRLHTCFKYELENIGWLWKFRLTTTGAINHRYPWDRIPLFSNYDFYRILQSFSYCF